jgi:hypothetical protein
MVLMHPQAAAAEQVDLAAVAVALLAAEAAQEYFTFFTRR